MMTETYTLKGIKTFNGMEGGGYEANLYLGKKKVGTCFNDGNGGCDYFHFNKKEYEAPFVAFCKEWYQTSQAKAEFEKLTAQYGTDADNYSQSYAMESWVSEFLASREEEKNLKRWSKTKTLFRLKGDPVGEWRTYNTVDPRVIPHIREKHGDQIERIYGKP